MSPRAAMALRPRADDPERTARDDGEAHGVMRVRPVDVVPEARLQELGLAQIRRAPEGRPILLHGART
jgi:hypothetical protein